MTCRLLGLDPSMTAFGWCMSWAGPAPIGQWQTGTLRSASLEDLAVDLAELISGFLPDMIACEQPLQVIMLYGKKGLIQLGGGGAMLTPNADQTILWKIEGMVRALAACAAIPLLMVPVKTWRAVILGDGNLDRDKAKVRAKQACLQMGINITSVDAAEAACVALYGLGTTEFRAAILRDIHGRNRSEVGSTETRQ
jgi:Holliday junction resolvasome RuvABC endonuclease subunit